MEDDKKYDFDFQRAFAEGNNTLGEELMLMEIDDVMLTLEKWGREDEDILTTLEALMEGSMPAEIHDDAPLTLEQAVCLPELGGSYTVNPELRSPAEKITVKTLRNAISRGDIAPGWKDSKNLFVTRRMIREWQEKCQREGKNRISSSEARGATRTGGSPTTPHGSSRTATDRQLALDAARMSMKKRS